jgi:hypothetical protein
MNRDDILRMADEAYELAKKDLLNGDYLTTGFLAIRDIHFHRLATAAEREACAKIVSDLYKSEIEWNPYWHSITPFSNSVIKAIRARGDKDDRDTESN